MNSGKQSTPAGNALFALVVVATLAALGWALWSLPGWLEGWRLNRTTGMIVLVALGAVVLLLVPVAAAVMYAVLGMMLEAVGVKINDPEPPAHLSADEESRTRGTRVHTVWYLYTEADQWDHDVTWGVLVSAHASAEAAQADCASRTGPPAPEINPEGRYLAEEPCNLAALQLNGMAEAAQVREILAGRSVKIPPKVRYSPFYYRQYLKSVPLSDEEFRRALETKVWTVYYEDHFHVGANRESVPVAVCFSAEEAEAEVSQRGPVQPGADGYLASGPHALVIPQNRSPEVGADTVREVLRRLERGERGAVPLR